MRQRATPMLLTRAFKVFVVLSAVLALGAFTSVSSVTAQGRGGQGPEGSWWIDVTFTSSPEIHNAHVGTFGPRGTYVQTAGMYGGNPYDTSGHGAWRREGDEWLLTFQGFTRGSDGSPAIYKVWATIAIAPDGNSFTAPFRVAITLPDGTVVQQDSGMASGTRLLVEPM
jgi:hypothetical protein